MKKLIFFIVFAIISSLTFAAETGPTKDSLYPVSFHMEPGDGLYIEFQAGSMPGCSNGRGGRLEKNNENYDQLYALLLTMMTTKSFKGNVKYKQTSSNGWWKCSITGISAFPK